MKTLHVQHEPKSEYDPYQNLAYEIILRAIADYRSLGQKLSLPLYPNEKRKVENEMKSISRFFLSRWCSALSGNDIGPKILKALDMEVFGDD